MKNLLRSLALLLLPLLAITGLGAPAAVAADVPYQSLPHYSRSPIGAGQEPVNYIYIGTENQIITLFVDHGWNGADHITPASLWRAYEAARTNGPYPTAPIIPAFIDGHHQDLVFQMPTATNSIAQRHHTRIWQTDQTTSDGRPIWVGTGSLDVSIAMYGTAFLPIHHVDADIAAERNFIVSSTSPPSVNYVQFNPAADITNSIGDTYHDDGIAAVIDLSGTPDSPVTNPSDNDDSHHAWLSQLGHTLFGLWH